MSKSPKLLPRNKCLPTNWADIDYLFSLSPVELASRAFWEGEVRLNHMSPLMWFLESGADKSLTELRDGAIEMAGRPFINGCFLAHELEDPARSLQRAYRSKLWAKAFELAFVDTTSFLLGLAKERFAGSRFLDPKSDETMKALDLVLKLEKRNKQGRGVE